MLNKENIYKSSFSTINGNMIILSPHPLLRPYIANYTFTDPSKMHPQQTILPTISSTLVCTFQNGQFTAGLRGVNTKHKLRSEERFSDAPAGRSLDFILF